MFKFKAHDWFSCSLKLGQSLVLVTNGVRHSPLEEIWGCLEHVAADCETFGLAASAAQMNPFIAELKSNTTDWNGLCTTLEYLQTSLFDELAAQKFFALTPGTERYFSGEKFPSLVIERFPDVGFDAEEAGKCLALERPTAAVFHLMRVTEFGLRKIGQRVGFNDEKPNWEPILAKINSEIAKPYKDRQFPGSYDFLAHIASHMSAVKVA